MRIIAGNAKGREIVAPKGRNTRPTLAKVKEAMFGMVQFDTEGAEVLDMFAGSGALGIEALSRGAAHAVFCESDRQTCGIVKSNLIRLGMEDRATVICRDAIAALSDFAANGNRFSLVLIDPPYASDLIDRALALLVGLDLLENDAIVICEHPWKMPPTTPNGISARTARKYGETALTYMTFNKTEEP